jgi:hypothetical protein
LTPIARLFGSGFAVQARPPGIASCRDSHVRRPPRRIIEAHPWSHLQVSRNQQRRFRQLLPAIVEHRRRPDIAPKNEDAADFVIHDVMLQLLVGFVLAVPKTTVVSVG